MTQELIYYVRTELAHGMTREAIKLTLTQRGYAPEQADQIIQTAETATPEMLAQMPAPARMSWVAIVLIVLGVLVLPIMILSAVVMASLNDARDKGQDAATKATLSNLRVQAEIYYDREGGSYAGFCDSSAALYDCQDSSTSFRINSAVLNDGTYYCVDSLGNAEAQQAPALGLSCL